MVTLRDILTNLQTLMPKPETMGQPLYDLFTGMLVDKLLNDVSAFINRPVEEIPQALDSSIVLKASSWLTDTGALLPLTERYQGNVNQIQEGDATVQWGSPIWFSARLSEMDLMDSSFQKQLTRYRRIRGWAYDSEGDLTR